MSQFINDLLSSVKRQAPKKIGKDAWIEKTAGSYCMGSKDVIDGLFRGIVK